MKMKRIGGNVMSRTVLVSGILFAMACGGTTGGGDAGSEDVPYVPLDCRQLTNPTNGIITFSDANHFRSVATYSCDTNYFVAGERTRLCESGGVWTEMAPTCAPETTTDATTDLTWQVRASEELDQATASTYCGSLVLGSHDDWRLPTIRELITLLDYSVPYYGLDRDVFPTDAGNWFYWSSTPIHSTSNYWISHSGGWGGSEPQLVTVRHARCVRGAALTGASLSAGVTQGTVADATSGLTWQATAIAGTYTQGNAQGVCAAAYPAGTWRLPTPNELLSIVDFTRSVPAIDTALFSGVGSDEFWTSTPDVTNPGGTWTVNMYWGVGSRRTNTEQYKVLCVH
jgi:hypothetical protein